MQDFLDYWKETYPETVPIGRELKWIYPNRWFRVHSLPESKRYAETEIEYNTLLNRQNVLLGTLIGEGTPLYLVHGYQPGEENFDEYSNYFDSDKYDLAMQVTLQTDEHEEGTGSSYTIFSQEEVWRDGRFDSILKAIADDRIRALFVCPEKNCIVAPYDGGVDVVVDSTERRDVLKVQFKDWLSKRDDGY